MKERASDILLASSHELPGGRGFMGGKRNKLPHLPLVLPGRPSSEKA